MPNLERNDHPSGTTITRRLKQPTRGLDRTSLVLLFGLAPGGVCPAAMLPRRRCALTAPFHPYRLKRRFVSVALSVGFRRPAVSRRPVRRSSDFPLLHPVMVSGSGRPASLTNKV